MYFTSVYGGRGDSASVYFYVNHLFTVPNHYDSIGISLICGTLMPVCNDWTIKIWGRVTNHYKKHYLCHIGRGRGNQSLQKSLLVPHSDRNDSLGCMRIVKLDSAANFNVLRQQRRRVGMPPAQLKL